MDKKKILAAGSAMVALGALTADNADAATKAIPLQAVVLQQIALVASQSLNFGAFSVTGNGTVVISTAGVATPTNANMAGATEHEGILKITAAQGYALDVSVAAGPATLTETVGGVATMTADTFVLGDGAGLTTAGGGDEAMTATLTAANGTVPIGGTLTFVNGQTTGKYTGSFTVNVLYQ